MGVVLQRIALAEIALKKIALKKIVLKEIVMSSKTDLNFAFGPSQKSWKEQVPDYATNMVSPPSADPKKVYDRLNASYPFEDEKIKYQNVQVPPMGFSKSQFSSSLETIKNYADKQTNSFLGYQFSEPHFHNTLNFGELLNPFLNTQLNNIGDPFVNGTLTLNSKPVERAVLDYFASLWNAVWPSQPNYFDGEGVQRRGDPDSYWGYVLTMGSTEGNLFSVLNARDYLSGRLLVVEELSSDSRNASVHAMYQCEVRNTDSQNCFTPIAFFSGDTHYSMMKAVHAMGVRTFSQVGEELFPDECPLVGEGGQWPEFVPSEAPTDELPVGSGAIDVDKLAILVQFFAERGYPIFIVLNYGTTFKGAYDDIPAVEKKIIPILKSYGLYERTLSWDDSSEVGDIRTGYWVHVDGALGAAYMPYVKMAVKNGDLDESAEAPDFDFKNSFIHSMVTSGHKWPGAPWPCGIYMSKQKYLVIPASSPDYIGTPDSTLAGSRNGFSAMVLWTLIANRNFDEIYQSAIHSSNITNYAYTRLKTIHDDLLAEDSHQDTWLQRSPASLAIIFRKPKDEIMFEFSLSLSYEIVNNQKRSYVHIFGMHDRTKEQIDSLVSKLSHWDAYDTRSEQPVATPQNNKRSLKNATRIAAYKTHGGWS